MLIGELKLLIDALTFPICHLERERQFTPRSSLHAELSEKGCCLLHHIYHRDRNAIMIVPSPLKIQQ